jgi:type I restriction enzyme R subunit
VNKKDLSERDICTKFITPALTAAGWDINSQVREQVYLTDGQVIVRGRMVRRGERKFADYVLYHKPNIPIAVLEAKDNSHRVGDGMQQALTYAEMLGVPSVYSSNGDGFLEHDRSGQHRHPENEFSMDAFPAPDVLWKRYCTWKGISGASLPTVTQDYYTDGSGKHPRYYQTRAINAAVESIAKGHDRVLLVMATGTGKTYTAFQIIWRLWKAGIKKRILFLADRDILLTQTKNNDFSPFGPAMHRIKNRQAEKSYEIYLALYQAISGNEEAKDIFKQFSPDFFDLVVVDECHRGSADENSAWREILDYFSSATQIGLTATPKETTDISTTHYFGDPVYIYSLKQGIEDGFLAPYKVVRIDLDKDLQGWRPEQGKRDKNGEVIEDRIYNQRDFDRTLVLEKRTELVARKVTEFLKATNRYDKTIVFCEDIDHAERMRQALVNENEDLSSANRKYVMRITGDSPEGKAELDNFINPEEIHPVIVTTSKLMSTGVDAQTCKLIVLDQTIQSMTEFKQIIGRGTRIREDYNKRYFTIIDFRRATELFADPDFDGQPVQIYQPKDNQSPVPPDPPAEEGVADGGLAPGANPETSRGGTGEPDAGASAPDGGHRKKFIVGDVPVTVIAERVQYYGNDGKLVSESLKDYVRKAVRKEFASLDRFLKVWTKADRKQAIVTELREHGVFFEELAEEVGKDFSAFDLVCHVAFDQPALTRKERANNVRKRNYFTKYGPAVRDALEALLQKYADEGVDDIETMNVLKLNPLSRLGTPVEIVETFGGKDKYQQAIRELEDELYKAS